MSSILDALRKLEKEKSSREEPQAATLRELTLEPDFEAPAGGGAGSAGSTIGFIIAGALILAGIAAGTVTTAVMLADNNSEPLPVASASAPTPSVQRASVQTIITPVPVLDDELPEESDPPSKPLQTARAAVPKLEKIKAKPKLEAVTAATVEKSAVVPLPSLPISAPEPPAAPPAQAPLGKINFDTLPILTESDRVRLGLPPLKINIVGIPNTRNPRASALINMQKVYVGENIPSTQARLVDVDLRGVAIEISGNRYMVSRR
ncbi:MAG: hypothetical protein SGI88_16595 [Candidatus Hydrogenedentes bacterium]|nr:hypothetical protein [Candidatus Hydrogenedentota bacterium]